MNRSNRFFLPAVAWLIIVSILLTLPGKSLPKSGWLDGIWFDKWVHIGLFAVMSFLPGWACYKKGMSVAACKKYFIIFAITCLAYGIGMEFVQKYFVPNRSFDLGDIVADGIGSIGGAVYCWWRYIKK